MGKKRKSGEFEKHSEVEEKQRKTVMEVEFTGTQLKAMLKDVETAFKGLETFLSLARKLPCTGLYDVVEGYIKISVECAEMFKLLDGEKRSESEMLLVFQTLEAILLRTASDLSHFSVVGMNIVKKLIHGYMQLLYGALQSESYRYARVCLNLLTAMVTQGPESARELFAHFDFNKKFLPGLVKKRDKQGRPDVRVAFIQFALSFLIAGDNAIIGQVLELKDFLMDVFSSGLKEDRISAVSILLSTLKTKVVQNRGITKTQKVRFFTVAALSHIASLYRWNGIVDVSTEEVEGVEDPKEAGKVMVRELVHSFLLDLCCSLRHGINFYDASLGTGRRPGNLVLLRFILGLKTATEDELVAELLVSILKVCPDLLHRFFKETKYSFVPRLKSAWLDNVKLLRKIYEAQPEISKAFKTREFVPLPRLLSMVLVTSVPPVCNKSMFTQGLNLPNKVVKHTSLSLITFILKRALKNIEYCLHKEIWQGSEIYTPSVMEDFTQQYRETLSKFLPDMTSIVATWQSLSKKEKEEDGDREMKPEQTHSPTEETSEITELDEQHGSDDAETTLLKTVLLQVVCLYQRVVPHLVAQNTFDFSKLLRGIVNERGAREEVPPVLQYHILQLALELPAKKFSWFKVQDIPDMEKPSGKKSVFYLLLKMFVTSSNSQLKASTELLIIKVLRDTGVFDYTWKELELWLKQLNNITEAHQETVIQFLDWVLIKLVSSPYPYTEKVAEVVQEASMFQASLSGQDSDTVSLPISHIDDVLDMMDVIVENSEGLDEEIGFALNEELIQQTFPFSAVIPAALEARNKMMAQMNSETASVEEYLVTVLTDVLHTQRDPLALSLIFQMYDKEVESLSKNCERLSQFYQYYSLWIPEQLQELQVSEFKQVAVDCVPHNPQRDATFTCVLKSAFKKGEKHLLQSDVKDNLAAAVSNLSLGDLLLSVEHVLLYIKSTVDTFSKFDKNAGASLLCLFMDLLRLLLQRAQEVTHFLQPKAAESQSEPDLFVDVDSTAAGEPAEDKVLKDILTAVFKHPTLEQWFMALELQSPPPSHNLNPVSVKLLSTQLNAGILSLLALSTSLLQAINHTDLVSRYLEAITQSILKELEAKKKAGAKAGLPSRKTQQLEGLEGLYLCMSAPQLQAIVVAVLQLPTEFLIVQRAAEDAPGLSWYGQTLVRILTENDLKTPEGGELFFSREQIKIVGTLVQMSCSEELEKVLLKTLQKETVFVQAVSTEVLTHCLNRCTEVSLIIAAFLIQHSKTHLLQFEIWCLGQGTGKNLRENIDLFVPLADVYLQYHRQGNFTQPVIVSSGALQVLKEAFWKKLINEVLADDGLEELTSELNILSRLIQCSKNSEDLTYLIKQLPEILEKAENCKKWILADSVSEVLENSQEELISWKKVLLASCIKSLVSTYSNCKDQKEEMLETEKSLLSRLQELVVSVGDVAAPEWNSFVKMGLKYRYKDCSFLKTLDNLIQVLYEKQGSAKTLVQLPIIHMMVTNHSLFLPMMLKSREDLDVNDQMKDALADILLTLVKRCPSVCDSNHFAVLLGAYGATLGITDQKLLLLLQTYEKNNVSLAEFRLWMWGPAAVEHHKTRKSLGQSLWQQPNMEEILSLLDREKMLQTILHYPQHRRLLPEEQKELLFKDDLIEYPDSLYDPCFLLPLFSALIVPEYVVDCRKFVDANALGLTVTALSSYDPKMRAAAYHVLGSFSSHLEAARFREKRQLQYLMDIVKNGIRQENLRLTFSLAVYVAKVVQQLLKPEEHMYVKISRFLLAHQYLDVKKVPGFYNLFYSFDFEHKVEREWVLGLLVDGLKDRHCYELYEHQRIFHIILIFFNSPLCDETTQTQILEVLQRAAHVTKAAYELIRDHSLLTWILQITEKRFLETNLLSSLLSLLHSLWTTNLGNKEKPIDGPVEKERLQTQKFLPLHLINEFLYVLTGLVKHIKANLGLDKMSQFLSMFSSVLRHRAAALEACKDNGWFTVSERVLSHRDILLLLHKWSVLDKNGQLQDALRSVAQKHKVKELLVTIKEKNRHCASVSSISWHGHKKLEEQAVENLDRELQLFHLEKCRDLLTYVFVYWEPVFASTPSLAEGQLDDSPEAQKAANELMCETTNLLVKWILKSLADHKLNTHCLTLVLGWLQKNIVHRAGVLEKILKDDDVRYNLLKLYNRVSNAVEEGSLSLAVHCIFSSIMVQLMNAWGLTKNPFFETVVEPFCLSALNEEDEMKKAAGTFLLSLYIRDLWLGAEKPEMFLTHVRTVSDMEQEAMGKDKEKRTKGKKQKEEETLVCLCRAILLSLSRK
ncbi:nucleolar pre-ribosomal-associated protein 1 [Latimeria chalumnae]|uniref:nucleolar pre-ribosomal-associated protein 1 n=1 Tax=Latimeria chalumnae TaxID=7897 RepID=UPI00313EDF61